MAGSNEFDVVIVGAGAAGCVVARRLAASDRAILLLEAGPDLRTATPAAMRDGWSLPQIPDWGFESEPTPDGGTRKLRRGRVVGGTSWLTRFAVRGAATHRRVDHPGTDGGLPAPRHDHARGSPG